MANCFLSTWKNIKSPRKQACGSTISKSIYWGGKNGGVGSTSMAGKGEGQLSTSIWLLLFLVCALGVSNLPTTQSPCLPSHNWLSSHANSQKKPSFKKAFIILWEPYTTYFDHIPSPPLTPSTLLSKVAFINKVTGTKDKMTRRELCIRGSAPEECWTLLFLSILRKLQSM